MYHEIMTKLIHGRFRYSCMVDVPCYPCGLRVLVVLQGPRLHSRRYPLVPQPHIEASEFEAIAERHRQDLVDAKTLETYIGGHRWDTENYKNGETKGRGFIVGTVRIHGRTTAETDNCTARTKEERKEASTSEPVQRRNGKKRSYCIPEHSEP